MVTPSSSYRTQDSASSLHEHRRSKSGKLRLVQPLQTEADRQGSLHSSSQAPGKASSQAPRLVRRRSLRKRTSSSPTVEACGAQQTPASGELAGLSAPALSPRQPQGGGSPEADFDPSSLPGLGTWAQRQFHFQQQVCTYLSAASELSVAAPAFFDYASRHTSSRLRALKGLSHQVHRAAARQSKSAHPCCRCPMRPAEAYSRQQGQRMMLSLQLPGAGASTGGELVGVS